MVPSRSLQRGTVAGVMLILLSLFGCARLNLSGGSGASVPPEMTLDADPGAGPVYGIEFIGRNGKTERQRRPLQGTLFLQQALEQCGAFERYGDLQVAVVRQPGPGKPPLNLKITLENGRVAYDTDYALHPGDRIVVRQVGGLMR